MQLVGIDVGGTFTDIVFTDAASGRTEVHKVPTTAEDPSEGVAEGILALGERFGIDRAAIDHVLHGTTIATNAVLEYAGAATGMITTEGYRDILHIGRHQRPQHYSIMQEVPWQDRPLVRRRHRLAVRERLEPPNGAVVTPLDEAGVRAAARRLKAAGVEAIAVCFLFSYLDPRHERRAREIVLEEHPGCFVCTSAEVSPQFREFERFTTTAMNAFVGPRVRDYVSRLEQRIAAQGMRADLHVMGSNGGVATAKTVAERPVLTLLSGPAAGVLGGAWTGALAERRRLITFDMGGTSADIGIVDDGRFAEASARDTWIAGYPLMVSMIDIHTIGAGGGSIARMDAGGGFRVGPESAGAEPGPAAYGRGGTAPTVTDANVVLGRLAPDHFLGGEMRLDAAAAEAAIDGLASRLGLSRGEAAEGVLTIVTHNMANAIRSRTVQKGIDPRAFSLVAFGGAGPLHAVDVARELGMDEVIVPHFPGITSAVGLVTTDLKYDTIRTAFQVSGAVDRARLNADLAAMEAELTAQYAADGIVPEAVGFTRAADLRYVGQGYELRVEVPSGSLGEGDLAAIFERFHDQHRAEYGHAFPDSPIEIVNLRLAGLGRMPKIRPPSGAARRQPRWRALAHGRLSVPHRWRAPRVRDHVLRARPTARRRARRGSRHHPPEGLDHCGPAGRRLPGPRERHHPDQRRRHRMNENVHGANLGVDPVTASVIQGALESIAVEMGYKLMRMSYSSIIRESEDFGAGLVDAEGRGLAESAQSTPLQSGPIPGYVRGMLALMAERGEPIRPGDVIMHNDAYAGASHGPDVAFIVPAFLGERLVGFAVTTAHHLDIGALSPGSCGIVDAIDAYAEGLQFRAVKVYDRGEKVAPVWQMLRDNIRASHLVVGDMEAQVAASRIGAERFLALIERHGPETFEAACETVMAHAERLMRGAIAALPDGDYRAETRIDGFLDADDAARKELPIVATVKVRGDEITVDLTGTADQVADRPINMPFVGTVDIAVWLTIRSVLLDTAVHGHIPVNDGLTRPIRIVAPKGSLANPVFPAPTIARFCPGNQLADTVMKALAQAVPRQVSAGIGNLRVIAFSGLDGERHWVHMEICEGSYGGRWGRDGMDAVDTLYANTRNNPIEDIESHLPLRVDRYELREDACGPGRWRGGLGSVREFRYLSDGGGSIEGEGHRFPPWGFAGGGDGETAAIVLARRDGGREHLPSKVPHTAVRAGDRFVAVGPAGGGYGDPLERDPQKVLDDVLDDLISVATAERDYGVVIADGRLDEAATVALRRAQRDGR